MYPTNDFRTDCPATDIPLPAIRRFPIYLKEIEECLGRGEEYISGALLADVLGLDRVLVRKDLALTGVVGTPRLGFPVKDLASAINHALGWDTTTEAILVGVGNLGTALLGYAGFKSYGFQINLAFDSNLALQGKTVAGVTVEPMTRLHELVRARGIELAILTVPGSAAQECADALVAAGIRGIWNFSPEKLNVPPEVTVQHENLASSLAVLSHAVSAR